MENKNGRKPKRRNLKPVVLTRLVVQNYRKTKGEHGGIAKTMDSTFGRENSDIFHS